VTSQHPPDIVLERDSTRIVDELRVMRDGIPPEEAVRIAPETATMEVQTDDEGGAVSIDSDANDGLAVLDGRETGGRLRLRDRANATGDAVKIELSAVDTGRPLVVRNDAQEPTTVFTATPDAGGVIVNDDAGARRARMRSDVVIEKERSSGLLEVYDTAGEVTGRVEGDTGAVVLDRNESGGEFLLQKIPTPNSSDHDVSVHATADSNSAYGLSQGVRPLVFLNGPDATVELGREKRQDRVDTEGSNRRGEGADGRVVMQYYDTETPSANPGAKQLLEAGVGWPESEQMASTNVRCGELVFRTAQGGTADCGSITSCGGGGLTLRTGDGTPALRIDDQGGIATAREIVRGGLPLGPLDIVPTRVGALPGAVVDVDVDVGNLTTLHVRFGDESDSGYELTATMTDIEDRSITLRFDTAAAGDTSTSTLSVVGNAQLVGSSVSETSLTGDLDDGDYEIQAEYASVSDTAVLSVQDVVAPTFDPEDLVVDEGDVAVFTLDVGQATELDLTVGDPSSFYGLEATVGNITGTSVEMAFDTASAGDPATETVFFASDDGSVQRQSVTETDLDGSLPATEYPVEARTVGGDAIALLTVQEDLGG
jgi:hypothetical protein